MKKQNLYLLYVLTFISSFYACSTSNINNIPKLDIVIPHNLADNSNAVSFIESNELLINRYSKTFNDLILECKPFANMSEAELTPADKQKLSSIMMVFMANMGQFTVKVGEMEQSAAQLTNELNDEDAQALLAVMEIFTGQINRIGESYESFGMEPAEKSSLLLLPHSKQLHSK